MLRAALTIGILATVATAAEPVQFGHLYCGDVKRAEILAEGEQHLWTIDLLAGDRIDIAVAADEPDIGARLVWRLLAPDGAEVGDISYRTLRDVHESGTYRVLVEDHFGQASGGYTIQAHWVGARGCAAALDCGYAERGTIDAHARRDAWFFDGDAGQVLRLAVAAIDDGFEPGWSIYGPSGRWYGSAEDLILPESGSYTLLVGSRRRDAVGDYLVTRLGVSADTACALPLEPDRPVRRRLAARDAPESYGWLAVPGDRVEIAAITLDAGAIPPRILVYDPTGYPLAQSSEGKALPLTARVEGLHTVLVWDTTDEFELSLRPTAGER